MNLKSLHIFLLLLLTVNFISCKNEYIPKPKGYFRIDLPEKTYQLSNLELPFQFEYPCYSSLSLDNSSSSEPYWCNIQMKETNASIHITYKKVEQNLAKLTEDSRELAYKHSIKASAINEQLFINYEKNVYGTIYIIKGNVASNLQLHLTDSVNHFLRASFYISAVPNYDSLSPVINFIEKDIYHLVETFTWK